MRQMHFIFDLITAFDVVEHLTRDELLEFLCLVHGRLKPRRSLILQLPNGDFPFVGSIFYGDATHETCLTAVSSDIFWKHVDFKTAGLESMALLRRVL